MRTDQLLAANLATAYAAGMRTPFCALLLTGFYLPLCSPSSILGQIAPATGAHFEVSTVRPAKPDAQGTGWPSTVPRTVISNMTLLDVIQNAYLLKTASQVVGGPDWMRTERFDIMAKMDEAEATRQRTLHGDERNKAYLQLVNALLVDRFGLRVAEETRHIPVYLLQRDPRSVAPSGTLRSVPAEEGRHGSGGSGHWTVSGFTMANVADELSGRFEVGQRVVLDRTGLEGKFAFELTWAPDRGQGIAADATAPALADALREQLGLKLVKGEGEVPVVVVQSVKKPEFD